MKLFLGETIKINSSFKGIGHNQQTNWLLLRFWEGYLSVETELWLTNLVHSNIRTFSLGRKFLGKNFLSGMPKTPGLGPGVIETAIFLLN
jgi:hypothetical protein